MGTLTIPASGRVYVDANAVIYAIERIEPYRTLLEPLWNVAATGAVVVMTSELPWLETLTKPLRDLNLFITNDPIFKRVPNLPVVILNEVANS